MEDQWYIARDKKKYGPYSSAQMKQMAVAEQLLPCDMVMQEGAAKWLPASQITGLLPAAPPVAVPPPVPSSRSANPPSPLPAKGPPPAGSAPWYYSRSGVQHGPVPTVQLKQLAQTGELQPTDTVWKDGMPKWRPASEVKGLFDKPEEKRPAPQSVLSKPSKPSVDKTPLPPSRKATHPAGFAQQRKLVERTPNPAKSPPRVPPPPPPPPLVATNAAAAPNRAFHQMLASWVFGSLLFLFFLGVFVLAPSQLPEFKHRMLAISCSLLAGLFAFFLTGSVGLEFKGLQTTLGKLGVRASGGVAAFVLVLVWWWSPASPIRSVDGTKTGDSAQARGPADPMEEVAKRFGIDVYISPEAKKKRDEYKQAAKKAQEEAHGKFGEGIRDIRKGARDRVDAITDRFAWRVDWSKRKLRSADFANLKSYTVMSTLILSGADFSGEDLRYLERLSNLRELYLDGTPITDADLPHLVKIRNLEHLDLAGTAVSDAGIKELAKIQFLGRLSLAHTHVTGSGLREFDKRFSHTLWRLSLRGCKITDDCLAARLTELVSELDLGETPISDAGLKHFKGKRLKLLYLDGTRVTDAGVEELENRLPQIKVSRKPPAVPKNGDTKDRKPR